MWHSLPWPGMGEIAVGGAEIFQPWEGLRSSCREILWALGPLQRLLNLRPLALRASGRSEPLPWPLSPQAAGVGGAQDQIGS